MRAKNGLDELLEEWERDDSVTEHLERAREHMREARRLVGLPPELPSDLRAKRGESASD